MDQVAGDLFAGEKRVGLIFVEAADYVITVRPGMLAEPIAFKAFAFSEANGIEPVAGPVFAIVRGGKQPVDQSFVSLRVRVVEKCFDFGRCRWQTRKGEREAADQGPAVGRG